MSAVPNITQLKAAFPDPKLFNETCYKRTLSILTSLIKDASKLVKSKVIKQTEVVAIQFALHLFNTGTKLLGKKDMDKTYVKRVIDVCTTAIRIVQQELDSLGFQPLNVERAYSSFISKLVDYKMVYARLIVLYACSTMLHASNWRGYCRCCRELTPRRWPSSPSSPRRSQV
jgi:hypothetical protein